MMPYCIGLTGGIGSGKSSAADMFSKLGAGVIDTDEISHELTRPGGSAMPAIAASFCSSVIARDGGLDRAAMRTLVFSDSEQRSRLEGILHPLIGKEVRTRLSQSASPYVILVVPLLLETGNYRDIVHRILVIDCEESQQIDRVMRRSGLTENNVQGIMAAQLTRQQRLDRADDIIRNDGDTEHLREQVAALHLRYLKQSENTRSGH